MAPEDQLIRKGWAAHTEGETNLIRRGRAARVASSAPQAAREVIAAQQERLDGLHVAAAEVVRAYDDHGPGWDEQLRWSIEVLREQVARA